MTQSFEAQVSDWVAATKERVEAVVKESAQDIASEMTRPVSKGGRMRIDTGFLRASLLASTSRMPKMIKGSGPKDGGTYPDKSGQISLVIAGADLGDPIFMGFTASYARHREYGANGQQGDGFVRTAAAQWPSIVSRNGQALKDRVLGS